MSLKPLAALRLDQLDSSGRSADLDWLWHGYLARGNLTILTSLWKAGETTLLTGLLQRLCTGGEFLGQTCEPAKALVVSEEALMHWGDRLRRMPISGDVRLLSRPFAGRPTHDEWSALIEQALSDRAAGALDVFVVDTLASFFPGGNEASPGPWLTMLEPLQRLAATGVAVLLMHHPRKEKSAEGNSARGSGALLSYVDIILELHRVGRHRYDERRRRLIGMSRHQATPKSVAYEWDPATGTFENLGDLDTLRFRDNWHRVRDALATCPEALSVQELLTIWPDKDVPAASVLHDWLTRAHREGLVQRTGMGKKRDPFRWGVG